MNVIPHAIVLVLTLFDLSSVLATSQPSLHPWFSRTNEHKLLYLQVNLRASANELILKSPALETSMYRTRRSGISQHCFYYFLNDNK